MLSSGMASLTQGWPWLVNPGQNSHPSGSHQIIVRVGLFSAIEQDMKDVALRKWSVSCRTQHQALCLIPVPAQHQSQHQANVALPPEAPELVFAASPGNQFWLPLRLHIVMQIPGFELSSSEIRTSRSALSLLPGGIHLGLPPAF